MPDKLTSVDPSATLARLRAVTDAAARAGVIKTVPTVPTRAPAPAPGAAVMRSGGPAAADGYVGTSQRPAPAPRDDRMLLLYNGACSVCRTIAAWIIEQDEPTNGGHQRIDERPIGHDAAALKALDPRLDIMEAYDHVHVILPDGTIKKDGEAVSEVLKRIPETSWLGMLLRIELLGWRPAQSAVNLAFKTLSELRGALGCTACNTPTPWWGKPIEWVVKAVKKIAGSDPLAAGAVPGAAKPA